MKKFWSDLGGKLGVGSCVAGLLLVFLGWNGAASVDRVQSQFPYLISGGIGGLCLVVIGVGLLIVQNQRADRVELQRSLRELRDALQPAAPEQSFALPDPRSTPERYQTSTEKAPAEATPAETAPAEKTPTRKAPAKKAPAKKAAAKKAPAKRSGSPAPR